MKTKKCLLVYLFCLVLLITQSSRVPVAKAATPTVLYYVAMDNSKVQAKKKNGQTAGYATKDKQIEAIWIKLSGTGYSGSVRYRSYVQVNGWKKWEKDGAMSGSKGKNRRLEAIEIKLTGEVAKHYDIYYRVYAKSYGWLGWAKNGEKAGTTGQGQKLRGIQIRLVEKDGTPPMDGNESAYKQFSMSKLLKTSIQPVGSTMYIYGGAWNEADDGAGVEAVTMGLSPRWAEYAAMQNASYNYRNTRYQIHDGLDCSGYVGWLVYNVMNDRDGGKGYVMGAASQARVFAGYGWGKYLPYNSGGWKPGDICSMDEHVWVCLGSCKDGSVLLVHASPPGVRICGTRLANGKDSQAVALAQKVMQTYYPEWYAKYPGCAVNYSYLRANKLRWKVSKTMDPEGLQKKSAEEIVDYLFNE